MIERETDLSTGAGDQVIPPFASDSWRAWLMTGVRRGTVARRRVRGAHKGLKKILVEGTDNGGERQHPWQDFSGVMFRQAVDEAVNTLPIQQKQVVKLAYFTGLTNREIGDRLGLSVAGVEKRLRQALATVSENVQRGRASGRRAALGVMTFLPNRLFGGAARRASWPSIDHLMQAGMLAGAGAAAAALLALNPATPAHLTQVEGRATPSITAAEHPRLIAQRGTGLAQKAGVTAIAAPLSQAVHVGSSVLKARGLPSLPVGIHLPVHSVPLPTLPALPALPPLPSPPPLPHLP
jgi:hypothetical protein